ncbi:MAG: SGNH/GDSL hydrolase family protein, partial [Oscillospiraceae bacterium]|nr:SGNH/GDSL hydrolase family protein [Oscillospiraceae bacterium]
MKRGLCLTLAVLTLLLCTACGPSRTASDSEEARDAAREEPAAVVPALTRDLPVAKALQRGAVQSILIIGDSISDGNTDDGCVWGQDEREALGCRLILTEENGNRYYENAPDSQGWVKFLRAQAEAAGASVFHNDAISGMSAKWFNAHKELLFTEQDRYDAIFVMLGTNDRTACQTGEEFRAEYGELLAYVAARCEYLTVLVPIPAIYTPTDTVKNMNSAEIAENVRTLCGEAGYDFIDCYKDFPQMAADLGLPLGSLYWGGTHPNAVGYRTLWTAIAHEPEGTAQPEDFASVTCIGCNRDDLSGETAPDAMDASGDPLYPLGVSWYYTWNTFTPALPYG